MNEALGILGACNIVIFLITYILFYSKNRLHVVGFVMATKAVIAFTSMYLFIGFWYLIVAALFKYLGS